MSWLREPLFWMGATFAVLYCLVLLAAAVMVVRLFADWVKGHFHRGQVVARRDVSELFHRSEDVLRGLPVDVMRGFRHDLQEIFCLPEARRRVRR